MSEPTVSTADFTAPDWAAWQVVNDRKLRMSAADLRAIVTAALIAYEKAGLR
jgi:hypothetical protein